MIGYYSRGVKGRFPISLIVPYNFSLYVEKKSNKIGVHYEPDVLEETVLALINEKESIHRDIEAGIVSLVDIPEKSLKELGDLVWGKDHDKAIAKIIRIFYEIKTRKENQI